jgi:hypothetical protein
LGAIRKAKRPRRGILASGGERIAGYGGSSRDCQRDAACFARLARRHKRAFTFVCLGIQGITGTTTSCAGSFGRRFDQKAGVAYLGHAPARRCARVVFFCSRTTLQDDRAAQGKTIWKAHSIRVANTADKRASPNRRRRQQRRRKIRKRKRCVIRSVRLPLVPALCIRLPT